MNATASPLRVGLVGTGRIARDWYAVLREMPEHFRVVGAVDPEPSARAWLEEEEGCAGYDGPREMATTAEVDLAVVSSPPATHEAIAIDLLSNGVHVLCEKPLTLQEPGALRMFDAAERSGRMLSMASKFRFVDAVEAAAAKVASGEFGVPILYENSFTGRIDMAKRWNGVPSLSGGGVLIDNGAHAADLARVLLGSPIVRVLAHFGRRIQKLEVEDTVRVLFEVAGGCIGTFDLSWSVPRRDPVYARIQCEQGTVELGWQESRWRRHDDDGWTVFAGPYDKRAAFRAQLRDVHDAIVTGRRPQVGVQEACDSVRVIEAAYRSAMVARWVPAAAGRS